MVNLADEMRSNRVARRFAWRAEPAAVYRYGVAAERYRVWVWAHASEKRKTTAAARYPVIRIIIRILSPE